MNEVAAAVRHKGIAYHVFGESVAAINRDAGGAGEVTAGPPAAFHRTGHQPAHAPLRADDPPRFVGADAIDRRRAPIDGDLHQRARHRIIPMARRVAFLIHQRLEMTGIGTDEFAPVIVEAQTVLPTAAFSPQPEPARVERKIAPAQIERSVEPGQGRFGSGAARRRESALRLALSPGSRRSGAGAVEPGAHIGRIDQSHLPAIETGGAVDPVVQRPIQGIQQRLHVEFVRRERRVITGEPRKNHGPLIGHTVPVGVLAIEDVRGGADEYAAIPANHGGGPRQTFGKYRALVEAPVAISVFEPPDAAQLLGAALRIVAHLDDVEPTVLIEAQRDGIHHQRLGRHQFNAEAGLDPESGQRPVGSRRRNAGKSGGIHLRFAGQRHRADQAGQALPYPSREHQPPSCERNQQSAIRNPQSTLLTHPGRPFLHRDLRGPPCPVLQRIGLLCG